MGVPKMAKIDSIGGQVLVAIAGIINQIPAKAMTKPR